MTKPPVAFFGFNRPDCTKIVFEAIRSYSPEKLFLVADGPRSDVPTDMARCESVREIMQAVDWPCEVHLNFSEQNMGCRNRMSSGIDWVFSQVEEAIFLEDDCVPCPDFFTFCTEMLTYYRDNPKVMHIGGANFQKGRIRGDGSYYFSVYPHVWGWASWRRAWQFYDSKMQLWPQAKEAKWIAKVFSTRLESEYWESMLEGAYSGTINTWCFPWAYTCWRKNSMSIIPNVNLITNIGAGPDATHTKGDVSSLALPTGKLGHLYHPRKISMNHAADRFTFETHYGGEEKNRIKISIAWIRSKLSSLRFLVKKAVS